MSPCVRRVSFCSVLFPILSACSGAVSDSPAGPGGESGSGVVDTTQENAGGAENAPCQWPEPEPVTKLLRLSNEEYRNIAEDLLGVTLDPALFAEWTPMPEVYGFDTMSEARIDARGMEARAETAARIAEMVLSSSMLPQGCAGATSSGDLSLTWSDCGQPLTTSLASRGFRRPLRAGELDEYHMLFDRVWEAARPVPELNAAHEAMTAVVEAILLSPNLTFKPELVAEGFDVSERSYRIASRLALFALGSIPDAELWAAAESGEFDTAGGLEKQAERLLRDHGDRFLHTFGGQWLGFRDPAPGSDPLLLSMREESRAVADAVFTEGMPAAALLEPGFTIVDSGLAAHYGLPFDAATPGAQRIETDARGGLLSQGYFLKRTATGSDFRRAIHRGLWTLTRLLCREMPRLDAATLEEISESLDAIDRTRPLSEQMEVHRNRSTRCPACHAQIDPVGLALEQYDPEGLSRKVDANGHPLVSDLELFGQRVADPAALASAIAGSPDYASCVAEKALTFALNRGPRPAELCIAGELAASGGDGGASLRDVVLSALLASFELAEVSR